MAPNEVSQIEALGFGTNRFYFFCTSQVVFFVFLNCNVAVLSVESIIVTEGFRFVFLDYCAVFASFRILVS